MPHEFKKEPTVIVKKTFNPKDHMTDEQIKQMENGTEDNAKLTLELDGEVVIEQPKAVVEVVIEQPKLSQLKRIKEPYQRNSSVSNRANSSRKTSRSNSNNNNQKQKLKSKRKNQKLNMISMNATFPFPIPIKDWSRTGITLMIVLSFLYFQVNYRVNLVMAREERTLIFSSIGKRRCAKK